jgi:allantoate deiminase
MISFATRAARLMARIDELAAISEDPTGVTRTFGTPAFLQGRALVQRWMEEAGLSTRIDHIGNLRGRLAGDAEGAQTFVIGSHIDTVVNAGKFDGPLGVLMGIDLLEALRTSGAARPFHWELVAFSDEEGVRFHTTYLGSKVLAGSFEMDWLDRTDVHGTTLKEALHTMGIAEAELIPQDALPANQFLGYFEAHIEQGPVLWERQIPVAVVTAIAGQRRAELTWHGMAGHAGTVPMTMRQDALVAAAEFVLAAEQLARTDTHGLVATVGKLTVNGAASNVIPGQVVHTLDLRSPDETRLATAYETLRAKAEAIAQTRGVGLTWQLVQQGAPVTCDAALTDSLAVAIADAGHEVIRLVSGAGHDAVPVAAVTPVTMLFIRCYKGISHNPLENIEVDDLTAALEVAERFVQRQCAQFAANS